ncbi:MAG: phosphate signaling complex protein PhoU [Lachnospiraceae bacterium]|nr:phosphate signaling complex protein PhoU [bacterium]MDY5517300.1 phosphate signaling complex protein PhoU [Lachnospiraceae bacterium]
MNFKKQLEQLNDQMITMGSMIENAIETAIAALVSQDTSRAEEAIAYDVEIDTQERNIEQLCYKLLLMQQPVASDLRVVSATMKMITDMERIGDHASDISELTLLMAGKPYIREITDIEQMAKETTVMVTKSVDAYVNRDLDMAREVIAMDDKVDDLFNKVKSEIIGEIRAGADDGEQTTDLLMAAKYFERIGDHATNIAEWVIFSLTGEHV